MAEAKKLTQKEYEAIRADYEKRYGYDSRSPEEKAAFDKKCDATDDDPTEPNEDINKGHERERERGRRGFREIDDDDER